jgi:hypothetical protein
MRIEVRDFSLGKAMPQFATAIEAQIDCDDASDDFIKEKPHSNIRSMNRVADNVGRSALAFGASGRGWNIARLPTPCAQISS